MYLYELAMELDQRSADLVEKAEALGVGPILAASELSTEQVQALRGAFGKAPAPAQAAAAHAAISLGPLNETVNAPTVAKERSRTPLVIGALVIAVIALAGFFMMKSEPDTEREDAIAADLDGWKEGAPATVAPSVQAEAGRQVGRNEPLDQDALCRAYDVVVEQDARTTDSLAGLEKLEADNENAEWRDALDGLRGVAADRGARQQALDDMVRFGPASAEDEIEHYRDTVAKYDQVIVESNDPELTDYVVGTPRYGLQNRDVEITRTRTAMEGKIVPFCGVDGTANDGDA